MNPNTRTNSLRQGWTTGACATAAAKAAYEALLTGRFANPVMISLPRGGHASFELAFTKFSSNAASAGIIKDAGDDPDITHGALIIASLRLRTGGIVFRAGEGVGTVTRPGLPLDVGEPAINPVPRQMISKAISEVAAQYHANSSVEITLSIPGGALLAEKSWNPRLGIIGGLSILGTTGIVRPYSCSAWVHAIHRGVDVARAAGLNHVGGATGSVSEHALRLATCLAEIAIIDMGDFVGGLLTYLRRHHIAKVSLAGGFAKMTKLSQGACDLHSARSTIDFDSLAHMMAELGASDRDVTLTRQSPTALAVARHAEALGLPLADHIARTARQQALHMLKPAPTEVELFIVDRTGNIIGHAGEGM